MDIAGFTTFLGNANLYDLYQLSRIINNTLTDPKKIALIKSSISVGQNIEYFDPRGNRLVLAIVVEKQSKKILVENIENKERWLIAYYMLNLSGSELKKPIAKRLDKNSLSVGDSVWFEDRKGLRVVGTVAKLNQKTAIVLTRDNHRWTVGYEWLSMIMDVNNPANIIDILPT